MHKCPDFEVFFWARSHGQDAAERHAHQNMLHGPVPFHGEQGPAGTQGDTHQTGDDHRGRGGLQEDGGPWLRGHHAGFLELRSCGPSRANAGHGA